MAGTLCPKIVAIADSTFEPTAFTLVRRYQIRANFTGLDHLERMQAAETTACALLPRTIDGAIITADCVSHDLSRQVDIDGNGNLDGEQVRCIIPDRHLETFQVLGESKQKKGLWDLSATYQSTCGPQDDTIRFSTAGGRTHITQSLATTGSFGNACNFGGAIGVRHGGEIDGCDIVAPDTRFTIKKCYEPGFIDCSKFKDLSDLVGTTNNALWDPSTGSGPGVPCFNIESLLFIGADGSSTNQGEDVINFTWKVEPPRTVTVNLPPLGGGVPAPVNIFKPGHQKLWVRYEKSVDGGCNFEVLLPESAYTERVYPAVDYGALFNQFGFPP